jgi:Protein of unknown function (DUF1573)
MFRAVTFGLVVATTSSLAIPLSSSSVCSAQGVVQGTVIQGRTQGTVQDWSAAAFPVKNHDFGTVAVASKTEFQFPIYNTFSSDMHIARVNASCGCTTPIVDTPSIPPGGSGSITARFNTGTFKGKKGATLTVVIDKPFYSEVRLRVDGYIRQDMVFHPGSIDFGKVNQGDVAVKSSKILYAGRSDWHIDDVRSNQSWLLPELKQISRNGGQATYELSVTLKENAPTGFFQDEIVVLTNDRQMPRVPFVISGTVESALSISPQSIAFGGVKPGESLTKRLVVRGASPFTIASITCEGWDVKFEPTTEAKTTHLVETTFTPSESVSGSQRVAIVITTEGENSVSAKALLTADIRDK